MIRLGGLVEIASPWKRGASRPGELVDHAGHRALARVSQDSGSTLLALEPSVISPGELVNTAGPRTSVDVMRDSWSTRWALRHGPEALGTTGQPREASGTIPSCPGQMVYHTTRVTPSICSTMRYVLQGSETPGTTG